MSKNSTPTTQDLRAAVAAVVSTRRNARTRGHRIREGATDEQIRLALDLCDALRERAPKCVAWAEARLSKCGIGRAPKTASTSGPSPAALTTLRYWNPADTLCESLGDDIDAHEAAGFDGLAECLDAGLLVHVPNLALDRDGYRPTPKGREVLAR